MAAEVRARMWQAEGRWHGRFGADDGADDRRDILAPTREGCLASLRAAAGSSPLTVEVEPELLGVAEAADLLGWDKRRIFTYLGRGSFPEPVAALASGRVWRRADIEAYAHARRARTTAKDAG